MKRKLAFSAILLISPLIASCSSTPATSTLSETLTPAVESPTASALPTLPAAPSENERGNLPKKLGESAGIIAENGKRLVTFKVTDYSETVKCTEEFAEKAENGSLVALKISVKTEPELANDINQEITFDSFLWKYIDADGKTFNGDLGNMSTYSCLPAKDTLPDSIGPAEQAEGWALFDLPSTDGTLIYAYFGTSGWEYDLKTFRNSQE